MGEETADSLSSEKRQPIRLTVIATRTCVEGNRAQHNSSVKEWGGAFQDRNSWLERNMWQARESVRTGTAFA